MAYLLYGPGEALGAHDMLSRTAKLVTRLVTINAIRATPLTKPQLDAPLPFGFAGGHDARLLCSRGRFQSISCLSLDNVKLDGDKTLRYSLTGS